MKLKTLLMKIISKVIKDKRSHVIVTDLDQRPRMKEPHANGLTEYQIFKKKTKTIDKPFKRTRAQSGS